MNNGPLLFLGLLLTMASSFWGLIFAPQLQIGRQQPVILEDTGAYYPVSRPGLAQQGAEVYRSLGCAECHTRQVRGVSADLARPGWGRRISVAQDYLRDETVQLGQLRLGPDLANYGARQTNETVILAHLYNPQSLPGSMMPPHRFLFDQRPLAPGEVMPAGAFALPGGNTNVAAEIIVPKPEARALAAYLMSLNANVSLFEAPIAKPPAPATNAVPTNATNAIHAAAPAP